MFLQVVIEEAQPRFYVYYETWIRGVQMRSSVRKWVFEDRDTAVAFARDQKEALEHEDHVVEIKTYFV